MDETRGERRGKCKTGECREDGRRAEARRRAGAVPEGPRVQWGCSTVPPFDKNYFLFIGILVKFRDFSTFLKIIKNGPHFPTS